MEGTDGFVARTADAATWRPSTAPDCETSGCPCELWSALPDGLDAEKPEARWTSPREEAGMRRFLKDCGCGSDVGSRGLRPDAMNGAFTCPGFVRAFVDYATWRARMLEGVGARRASRGRDGTTPPWKVLVVRTDWKGIGAGHMGPIAAEWLVFAMVTRRVLFIDERAHWNFQDYFRGYLGLDLRLTREMRGGLEAAGLKEEVLDFTDPSMQGFRSGAEPGGDHFIPGDADRDEPSGWVHGAKCRVGHCVTWRNCTRDTSDVVRGCGGAGSCHLGASSEWTCRECLACSREILLRGDWVTVVGNRVRPPSVVDDPDMPHLDERRALWRELAEAAGPNQASMLRALWPDQEVKNINDLTVHTHPCLRCAFFALFRPKWPMKGKIAGGQNGDGRDEEEYSYWAKLMGSRIGHAAPGTLGCLKIRTGYPEDPRCFPDDVRSTATCIQATLKQPPCTVAYAQHMASRLQVRDEGSGSIIGHVNVSDVIGCMRRRLGNGNGGATRRVTRDAAAGRRTPMTPVVHLSTDAPAIQNFLAQEAADIVMAFEGAGVDLNNGYRGTQDSSAVSRRKVALDFYAQGWCDESVALSPSEFFYTGALRLTGRRKGVVENQAWGCATLENANPDLRVEMMNVNMANDEAVSKAKAAQTLLSDNNLKCLEDTWGNVKERRQQVKLNKKTETERTREEFGTVLVSESVSRGDTEEGQRRQERYKNLRVERTAEYKTMADPAPPLSPPMWPPSRPPPKLASNHPTLPSKAEVLVKVNEKRSNVTSPRQDEPVRPLESNTGRPETSFPKASLVLSFATGSASFLLCRWAVAGLRRRRLRHG